MSHVTDIQIEIEALSEEEFMRLGEWFAAKDWHRWNAQLERNAKAGKLDFLLEEAILAKVQCTLESL